MTMASIVSNKSQSDCWYDRRRIVLQNVPPGYDSALVKDYVEANLDVDVEEIIMHPFILGKVLVKLKNKLENFISAAKSLKNEKLENQEILLLNANKMPAVVVTDIDFELLEEEFLKLYLECTFANGEDIIQSCKSWSSIKVAVVHFTPNHQSVVDKILASEDHIPLPSENYHICIHPFFQNFHDHIDPEALDVMTLKQELNIKSLSIVTPIQGTYKTATVLTSPPGLNSQTASANKDSSENEEKLSESESSSASEDESEEENKSSEDGSEQDSTSEDIEQGSTSEDIEQDDTSEDSEQDDTSEDNKQNPKKLTQNDDEEAIVTLPQTWNQMKTKFPSQSNKSKQSAKSFDDSNVKSFSQDKINLNQKAARGRIRSKSAGKLENKTLSLKYVDIEHDGEVDYDSDHIGQKLKPYNHSSVDKTQKNNDLPFDHRNKNKDNSTTKHSRGKSFLRGKMRHDSNFKTDSNSEHSFNHIQSSRGRGFHRGAHNHNGRGSVHYANPSRNMGSDNNNTSYKRQSRTKEKEFFSDVSLYKSLAQQQKKQKMLTKSTTDLRYCGTESQTKSDSNSFNNFNRRNSEGSLLNETIPISRLQAKCLHSYLLSIKECEANYDEKEKAVSLKGQSVAVRKWQVNLLQEMRKINEANVTLCSEIPGLSSREKAKVLVQNLRLEFKNVFIELDGTSVKLAAFGKTVVHEAEKLIREKLEYTEKIPCKANIPDGKIKELKLLEYKYLVKLNWDTQSGEFEISGIKEDVLLARKDVELSLEDFGIYDKSFDVGKPLAKYFHACLEDQINFLLVNVKISKKIFDENQIFIRFQGSKAETKLVSQKLESIKAEIKIKKWNLLNLFKDHEVFLIANSFRSGCMKKVMETYIYRNKCLIDISHLSTFNIISSQTKKDKPVRKSKTSNKVSAKPNKITTSPMTSSKPKLFYAVTNTCHLIIKSKSDIVKEKSDILVSVLGTDHDLRKTRVGGSFHHACKSHWKEVNSSAKANPNRLLVTVRNPKDLSTCMAICHIILEPWDPYTSSTNLISAIQQVLNEAIALGATSISFPPLGCGKAFRFPTSNVAQAMFQAFQSMNVGGFLQKIVLLAPDQTFFNDLKQQASQQYKSIPSLPKAVPFAPPVYRLPQQLAVQNNSNLLFPSAFPFVSPVNSLPQQPSVQKRSNPLFSKAVPRAPPVFSLPKTVSEGESSEDSSEDSDDDESDILKVDYPPSNDKNQCTTEIVIIAQSDNAIEECIGQLQTDFAKHCLHKDYYNQDVLKYWPGDSRRKIIEQAKKLSVWVERSQHPKTKYIGYIIKGEQLAVNAMKLFINDEFHDVSKHLPKQRMNSSKAPKRGTLDFLKYAAESDELFPSYWSLNESKSLLKSLTSLFGKKQSVRKILVDVDKETKDAICSLVMKTFDPNLVGQGNDAIGLSHSSIKILNVQRVENLELFEIYREQRKRIFRKMLKMKQLSYDIGKLHGSKGRVETTQYLSDKMKQELYYEVNEHYLFHGAKAETIDAIIHHNIDPKLASDEAMFGKGVYTAERSTKSDQYTDSRQQRTPNGTKLTMILVRMLLGNVFLCDQNHKNVFSRDVKKLSRPPCMKCYKDKCLCTDQVLFDSVMGDGQWLFREFVVYEGSHCYPEYVITYKRK